MFVISKYLNKLFVVLLYQNNIKMTRHYISAGILLFTVCTSVGVGATQLRSFQVQSDSSIRRQQQQQQDRLSGSQQGLGHYQNDAPSGGSRQSRNYQSDAAGIEQPQVRPPVGRNVCGPRNRRYCCKGWDQHEGTRTCTKPECKSGCGDGGTCMRPNLCMCSNNQLAPSCSGGPESGPKGQVEVNRCPQRCLNGGQCGGVRCQCSVGFQGPNCGQPICGNGCKNSGRCIGPNKCACNYGFTGRTCQTDYRTGPCFTQITNQLCRGQLTGVVCTKTLCCATIGKAWGNPCEQCPDEPNPCRRGYILNIKNNQCQDIDECQAIPGLCVGGRCINTVGSYTCDCQAGQTKNPYSNVCQDINECETISGVCRNGECINTEGSFFCRCGNNYELGPDRTTCISARLGSCYATLLNDQCIEPHPSDSTLFQCCCMLAGQGWSENSNCQLCPDRNTEQYRRLCETNDMITDVNGDICELFPKLCENGKCIPTQGSFRCECNEGFRLSNDNVCNDIDECEEDKNLCQPGDCINMPGSFRCVCGKGFTLTADGKSCSDMNECDKTGMCPNGECYNMEGSYKCVCNAGYIQTRNQQLCVDIDECTENGRICLNGRCSNIPGSYRCICNVGYELSVDGAFCTDILECSRASEMCANGQCINMEGSYKCMCNFGYKNEPGGQCIDRNECEEFPNICVKGLCVNNQGSYRCKCTHGFVLAVDGKTCVDVRKGSCYTVIRNAKCFNPTDMMVTKSVCCCSMMAMVTQGIGWGNPCELCPQMSSREYEDLCSEMEDVNECIILPSICEHGFCENVDPPQGFRCICDAGYITDDTGRRCSDINECEADKLLCDGGNCRNTPGSFQCACPTGYQFNSRDRNCEDINECVGISGCVNGNCVNNPGSYRCECTEKGHILDPTGRICIDNRRGACWSIIHNGQCEKEVSMSVTKAECCSTIGKAWGSPCEECPKTGQCPSGYSPEDGTCVDVNECELFSNVCIDGFCQNRDGSFICTCPSDLTLDPTGKKCIDMREDVCYARAYRGQCTEPMMGLHLRAMCCCSIGKAWGQSCEPCPSPGTDEFNNMCLLPITKDINECMEFPNICQNGKCRNTFGSFICSCNQGFALNSFGTNCTDIDECRISQNPCGNGTCVNTPGRFACECFEGFTGVMMNMMCMDIDECVGDPSLCRGGDCMNTVGSFYCQCPDGHELMLGGKECKDIDECSENSGICSNGRCENFMGGFECICDPGYKSNALKTTCVDIDECEDGNGGCMTQCINTPGGISCGCEAGFHLMEDGKRCVDVDECRENPNICSGGECTNIPGTYSCSCGGGLMMSPDRKGCLDVDECQLNRNLCLNGACNNDQGSFHCECDLGYSVKEGSNNPGCTDNDECDLGTDQCDVNGECLNTAGSYRCTCLEGFQGSGIACRDINECIRIRNGGCHADAMCVNTPGTYRCVCDEGFEGDGRLCRDVDECTLNPSLCDNGQCLNYPGGYRCECDMGFTPKDNARVCVDINECEMFRDLCVNGKCENAYGIFTCTCNQGYKLDAGGGNCTDVDECQNPDNCQYGTCINKASSYICQCPPDYELNPSGTGCVDKRQGTCYLEVPDYSRRGRCSNDLGRPMSKATCCCTVGQGWGETPGICTVCAVNGSREYDELCPGGAGFRPNTITVILEDIDECAEVPNICHGGKCQNTFGSFICVCPQGYKLDEVKRTCVDINECELNSAICGVGTCMNIEGNYTCACPDGHMLMPDRNCMDTRQGRCFRSTYNDTTYIPFRLTCDDPIPNPLTKKICCCSVGKGWNVYDGPCEPCPRFGTPDYNLLCGGSGGTGKVIDPGTGEFVDIDECDILQGICENGRCRNTVGSFRCDCSDGYRYESSLHICQDIDECTEPRSPCVGHARCVNIRGSFECVCPLGYKLAENKRFCIDINECLEDVVCQNGECMNLFGSFSCICNPGYKLSTNRHQCIDVNECQASGMCDNGVCSNMDGSYKCSCNNGFRLTVNGDCIDIDECTENRALCRNGRCRNIPGTYNCICQQGYDISNDGSNCIDIDECRAIPNICENGLCYNRAGSFECRCNEGYELTQSEDSCIDINECQTRRLLCQNGECANTPGSFICSCPDGFILNNEGEKCIDIRNATCFNEFRNGRCSDARRHSGTGRPIQITRAMCCCSHGAAWGSNPCSPCPIEGEVGYLELCPHAGTIMSPDGIMKDINECETMPGVCQDGECINTDRSFRCHCSKGYKLDSTGRICIDDNECQDRFACGNGTCKNVIGGFECKCNPGFTSGRFSTCEDIDECYENTHLCAFRCENTRGSFRCVCPRGYMLSGDGTHCEDVDECQTHENNCRYACKNIVGSFMCICPEGYTQVPNSDECRDIDECRTLRDPCENGRCINRPGGYRCDCFGGFVVSPDGKYCSDRREGYCFTSIVGNRCVTHSPQLGSTTKGRCCCGLAVAWGRNCEICPQQGTVQFNRLCPAGPGYTPDGEDIDECATMPGACDNGRCINTMGSYRCSCNDGYKTALSGSGCGDIDECSHEPRPCEFTCQNLIGSYLCSCPQGYVLNIDGKTCRDLDECTSMRHTCPYTCINTPGSFTCGCSEGFRQLGRPGECVDIDECLEQPGLCQPIGTCHNIPGSYTCVCPRGYHLDEKTKRCTDMNECEDDLLCEYGCDNMPGGYKCDCPIGFVQTSYYAQCVDENECVSGSVCGQANCRNTMGSFQCGCPGGMLFDPLAGGCIGLGGGGCGASPCSFGCTATGGAGFVCGCPPGFQTIGQGHCISSVSPPGSSLPAGVQLPHVPAPKGSSGVPAGEGCYSCNVNSDGIPLQRPLNQNGPQYLRVKRHASDEYVEQEIIGHTLVLDVRGPHSKPPANLGDELMINETISNTTVIHVMDLVDKAHMHIYKDHHKTKPTLAPLLEEDESDSSIDDDHKENGENASMQTEHEEADNFKNLTRTMDLRPDKPVVLYIWRQQTAHKARVMQVLPSLNALKHNEVCQITKGNMHDLFKLKEKRGMSSLHFTRKVKTKSVEILELTCRPVQGEGTVVTGSNIKLEPFTISLEIHLL